MSWDLNKWMCGGKTVFHKKDQHNTQVMQSLGEHLFLLGFQTRGQHGLVLFSWSPHNDINAHSRPHIPQLSLQL